MGSCSVGYPYSCLVLGHLFVKIILVTMSTLALVALPCVPGEGMGGFGRMSLLLLFYVTDIVTFSLASCSLTETHQEAGYGAYSIFPPGHQLLETKPVRQLDFFAFYSVVFFP